MNTPLHSLQVQYSDLGPAPVAVGSVTTQSVGKDEPEVKAANPAADISIGGPATAQPPSQQKAAAILAAEGACPCCDALQLRHSGMPHQCTAPAYALQHVGTVQAGGMAMRTVSALWHKISRTRSHQCLS